MWDIVGAIAGIILVIGLYVYYGRMALEFVRKFTLPRRVRKQIELQQLQQILDSLSEEELKGYAEFVKEKIEKEKKEKRKGIFRA